MSRIALLLGFLLTQQPQAPDLILLDGRIFNADDAHQNAEAIAIRGDRIVAVGTSKEILALAGPATKQIQLEGRVVIPGINDAHFHLAIEPAKIELPLKGQDPSWKETTDALAAALPTWRRGRFIRGTVGPTVLDEPLASRATLDKLSPDAPVILSVWSGHASILNSAAMKALGVTEASGRFFEYANFNIGERLARLVNSQDAIQQTRDFLQSAVELGITSVQDMSMPVDPERAITLFDAAPTPIRIRVIRFPSKIDYKRSLLDRKPPLITRSGAKWILDGTPIERSAAMRQPYADRPATSGAMNFTQTQMEDMLRDSLKTNDQLMVHIVGDRTTETFFNAMDATGGKDVWSKRRVRIEHGDGLMPDLIPRAKELGVIVVQNPSHFSIGELMVARFGAERARQLQPMQSLLKAGIPVAIGSDGPLNPYLNIMFANIYPEKPTEALTREQAVIAYTRTSAYAEFAENSKGTLTPGKLADLAVLSQDIFHVHPLELPKTKSVLTIVGGKIVYDGREK